MEEPIQKGLAAIGDRHRYQYIAFFILFIYNGFANLLMVGPTFIFMNPLFRCQGFQSLLDQSEACPIIDRCSIDSNFTITARLKLYCEGQNDRNMVQYMLLVGSFVGFLLINHLSQTKGRKFAILLALYFGITGNILTLVGTFYFWYWVVVVGQIACGVCAYPLVVQSFIYIYEIAEDVFRQRAFVAINYAWAITYCLIGLCYYFFNYWLNYLVYVCILPMIAAWLFSLYFLVEGPNYLYRKNQLQDCHKSLLFIAKVNGKTQKYNQIASSLLKSEIPVEKEQSLKSLCKNVCGNKLFIRMMVILSITEAGCNLYYWGQSYVYDQIGYEFGVNCFFSGIFEGLAYLTLNLIIQKLPRKKSLLVLYILLALIGFLFFFQAIQESSVGSTVVLGILRFISTLEFTLVLIFMTECFPGEFQSFCTGIVQALGQMGSALGPVVVNFCINLQVHPMIVLSVFAVALILLPFSFMVEPPKHQKEKILLNQTME